ncbi:MAG: HTTM domain-containing protein [Planctomycetota bacterium]|nr:HTTM domain-containing protein [Planctomycetota bacterium]
MNTDQSSAVNSTRTGRIFSLDLRSLAVFRMAWGLTLIADLIFRWSTLREMYTDEGFFTRQLSYDYLESQIGPGWSSMFWSLYWFSGTADFAATLFVITGLLAVLLVVGCWTRVVTVGVFVLLVSLHYRNPLVMTSGDLYFKTLLLWSLFLPLGHVWSWDAWRAGRKVGNQLKPLATLATAGLILQIIVMYFFTGISKLNEVWFEGDAMWYVLRLDIYITPFGRSLLEYPALLKLTSWLTLFFEVVWIWTLLVPWKNDWFRWSNIVVFAGFHVGIGMAMSIGLFPVICILPWIALLPGYVWPGGNSRAPQKFPSWEALSIVGRLQRVACILLLLLTVLWNLGNIQHPATSRLQIPVVQRIVFGCGMDQHFQMFSKPPDHNPWFVYEAELKDGTRLDLLTGGEITTERPESVREIFPTFHWRKFHRNLVSDQLEFLRQPLADYWVRQWNETHPPDQQVVSLRLVCYMEEIGPDYNEKNRVSFIWGSFKSEQSEPGSLFEQMLKQNNDLPF